MALNEKMDGRKSGYGLDGEQGREKRPPNRPIGSGLSLAEPGRKSGHLPVARATGSRALQSELEYSLSLRKRGGGVLAVK